MKIVNINHLDEHIMNEYYSGQLIRLCRPSQHTVVPWTQEVSVYILHENGYTEHVLYPINTIGMILISHFQNMIGMYQILIGNNVAIISDSFIKSFEQDEIMIDYHE